MTLDLAAIRARCEAESRSSVWLEPRPSAIRGLWESAVSDIEALVARVEELETNNAGLRRALEPFARLAREFDDGSPTGETWPYDGVRAVTYGDLRHAHAALEVPPC